ncbi:MAG: amidase family protein, partial [Phenylobacterium sp.]
MEMPDYSDYDGLGLAELVAKRAVTPAELVDSAIERIERHNPTLNAVVYKGYDDARAWAKADLPDGPFKGVPFLIKDLGMPVAGWPRSHGSKFARGVVDSEDGGLTARYRAA